MESQSNLIVFSSKHSTVSPSDNNTSTVQSQNDDSEDNGDEMNDQDEADSIAQDANMLMHADRKASTISKEGDTS